MRILQLTHQYPPDHIGGTELYTQSLATALAQRHHHVAVFTRRDRPGQGWDCLTHDNVQVYSAWDGVMSPSRRYLTFLGNGALTGAFDTVLDQFRPDLVHVQHLFGLPTTFIRTLQKRRIPYLVTLWDYWWVCANANLLTNYSQENCHGPQAYLNCTHCVVARAGQGKAWVAAPAIIASLAWRGHLLKQILQQAATVIAPSRFVQDWYKAHGLTTANLQVLGSGIESPPKHFASRVRPAGMPLRLLYLGGIAPLKGIHILLQAFQQVKGAVELWIGGNTNVDPSYTAQLQQLATAQTRFLGSLNRSQIWATLAQVDAVVVPSLSYETYCFVAREAFAAGIPVLAAAIGALSEVVQDNLNGLLLPPGDIEAWRVTIQRCVDTPDLLSDFQKNIPVQPTVAQHVDQIETIYQTYGY
jgi:glycosyltransferase involved in cell wall biosynthesis